MSTKSKMQRNRQPQSNAVTPITDDQQVDRTKDKINHWLELAEDRGEQRAIANMKAYTMPIFEKQMILALAIRQIQTAVRGYGNDNLKVELRDMRDKLTGMIGNCLLAYSDAGQSMAQRNPEMVVFVDKLLGELAAFYKTGDKRGLLRLVERDDDPSLLAHRRIDITDGSGMSYREFIGLKLSEYEGTTSRPNAAGSILAEISDKRSAEFVLSPAEIEAEKWLNDWIDEDTKARQQRPGKDVSNLRQNLQRCVNDYKKRRDKKPVT